jgi:LPS sulfotransferase NodH
MKGCLVLTTKRSGSTWLGSLITNTGTMGNCWEWLHSKRLGGVIHDFTADGFVEELVKRASTENGRFSSKIFPSNLYRARDALNIDLVRTLREKHDIGVIFLRRRDRLRQAISLAKSEATGRWNSLSPTGGKATYSFDAISYYYFYLERGYTFLASYLDINQIEHETFYYEDLVADVRPPIEWAARHLGVEPPQRLETGLTILRDKTTEEWVERFRSDLATGDLLARAAGGSVARSPSNLLRFFAKEPLRPVHF